LFQLEDEKSHLTEIIRLKEMDITTLNKSLAAKAEKKRLQAIIGDKDYEEKQKLESHIVRMHCYLFTLITGAILLSPLASAWHVVGQLYFPLPNNIRLMWLREFESFPCDQNAEIWNFLFEYSFVVINTNQCNK
jgi:hypothetical protein